VAPEASSDAAAAVLAERLISRHGAEVAAAGRSGLREVGVRLVCDTSPLGQVGVAAVVASVPLWWWVGRHIPKYVKAERPDVLVLFACRKFSLMLLNAIAGARPPVAWVYPPGDWVQGDDRDDDVMRAADLYVSAFDWQAGRYERQGARVLRVPHHSVLPLTPEPDPGRLAELRPSAEASPVIALMPGSRPDEVGRLMPIMAEALGQLAVAHPRLHAVVSQAPGVSEQRLSRYLVGLPCSHVVSPLRVRAIAAHADAAVVCCGTAATETAVADCPQVIVYKPAWLTAKAMQRLGRRKNIRFLSMVNLGLDRRAVPELLHTDCTPERIVGEVSALLTDAQSVARMREDYREFRAAMGRGSWDAAADAIAALAQRPGGR